MIIIKKSNYILLNIVIIAKSILRSLNSFDFDSFYKL